MKHLLFSAVVLLSSFYVNAQLDYQGYVAKRHVAQSVTTNSGKFIFVTHDHKLSAFSVNQSTGKLKEVQQFGHDTGGEFGGLFVSHDDRFLYAGIGMNSAVVTPRRSIVIYEINQSTGKLTLKKSFDKDPQFQNEFTSHFSISPKGNLLFIGDNSDQDLKVFRIDPETGMPEYLFTNYSETLRLWSRLLMSPDQKHIYIGSGNTHKEIVTFSFDETTGAVRKTQEIEFIEGWKGSTHLIISPDGNNVYAIAGSDDEKIFQYDRDAVSGDLRLERKYDNFKPRGKKAEFHFLYADRNADFLYAFKSFGDGDAMHVIQRDPITGNLEYKESFYDSGETSRLNGAFQICFSADNRYAYVSGMWDGALNIFYNPQAREPQIVQPVQEVVASNNNEPTAGNTQSNNNVPLNNQNEVQCDGEEISSKEFGEIWNALASEESDITRLEKSFGLIEGKCMKVVQAAALSYLFNSEYKRLEFVKFVSYFLHDKENVHLLAEVFQYDRMRAEVLDL